MTENSRALDRISIVDSHTAGEPTRCIVSGSPDLGSGNLQSRLDRLSTKYDHLRRALLCEPRGSDVLVGAWLLPPDTPDCATAVIFFNNAGYLGMCGHGTIGVAATLVHLGRLGLGTHAIQTPVGTVKVKIHTANLITVDNIAAYRHKKNVTVDVPGYGFVTGDVAWGGNWFFVSDHHATAMALENVEALTSYAVAVRKALAAAGITGADGAEVDHIELSGTADDPAHQSRNFVLCPGGAYDRSPCGTGTSAKMACLVGDGNLEAGEVWKQEGILGSVFEGQVRIDDDKILPSITGSAYITAESSLIFDAQDPFRNGIGG